MSAGFELSILGCNSAFPSLFRNPSCQYLRLNNHHFLIDCGEGAQRMMSRMRVSKHKISHIFISHLHGDHFFGLPGLLNSLSLGGREHDLTIYSPPGLKKIIEEIQMISHAEIAFPVHFIELEEEQEINLIDDSDVGVNAFPVKHRIPCYGFSFYEKKSAISLDADKLNALKVPPAFRSNIAKGEDFIAADGTVFPASFFEGDQKPLRSYAYCTDTIYSEDHIAFFEGVDLLYHEATFEHALLDKAVFSMHTTALQAGELAKRASVRYLLMGHFSNRYRSTERLCHEARSVFEEAYTVEDGMTVRLDNAAGEIKMLISY